MLRLLKLAILAAGLTMLLALPLLANDLQLPPVQVYKDPG